MQHLMLNFRPMIFSKPHNSGYSNFTACITLLLLFTLSLAGCAKKFTEPRAVRGFIVSSVVASQKTKTENTEVHADTKRQREIYLPNIDVYLNATDGTTLGPMPTDLTGRFSFTRVIPGDYELCWKAPGFVAGCLSKPVAVTDKIVHLGLIQIAVERKPGFGTLVGHVSLMDGSLARGYNTSANINAFPLVTALVDDAPVRVAYVNDYGNYLLPQIPAGKFSIVRTAIDKAKFDRSLGATVLSEHQTYQFDIRLPNSKPALQPLIARNAAGKRVRSPSPGEKLTVTAEPLARQKQALRYRWHTASGNLSSNTDPSISWQLPANPGDHSLELISFDDAGGYRRDTLILNTAVDGAGIVFSGQVRAADLTSLPGVTVTVAGTTTTTDATGGFRLKVKDQDRYILQMQHPNYALLSQIYDAGIRGGQWTMYPAQVFKDQDPRQDIVVSDSGDKERCFGTLSSQLNWKATPLRDRIQFQNGSGKVIEGAVAKEDRAALASARQQPRCGPGATVKIPANSLRDGRGNAPTGLVDVKISTIPINAPNAMPGDWTSIESSGETRVMQSYGAATIDITDAMGTVYSQIGNGAKAQVTIPVDPLQLSFPGTIPSIIPYLSYNENTGLWERNGNATLDATGQFYSADTTHFSPANMDVIKVDQACVKLDATLLPGSFSKVEVIIPDPGGAAPLIRTGNVDNSGGIDTKFHALYNLPKNEDIYVVPINVDDTGTEPDQPFGQFSVNTGEAQVPTDPNNPKFTCDAGDGCIGEDPYGACRTTIVLSDLGAPEPPDPANTFLSGLEYLPAASFLAVAQPALVAAGPDGTDHADAVLNASQNYYETVDPHSTRRTLDEFKTHHAYPGAAGEIHAIYGNSGDLGFGRDMHCWENACAASECDVICYVTNYLDGNSFESNDSEDFKRAIDAENSAGTDTTAVATVAMEYARLDDPTTAGAFVSTNRVVKFFVYAGDGTADGAVDDGLAADGTLLLSADLDGNGTRPVPQLCMVCHAGSLANNSLDLTAPAFDPADPTTADLDSVFLPFDLEAFTFVDGYDVAWDKNNQQQAFKDLNDLIVSTHPASATAMAAMHTKFYENWIPANPATHQQASDFAVPDWTGDLTEEQLYKKVIAPSCRACHTAQHNSSLTFDSNTNYLGQSVVDNVVCQLQRMPHAKATYERFWLSLGPHQPALLDNFGNSFMAPWIDCSTAPPVVVTDLTFDGAIADIVDANGCTGSTCHDASSPADGFHLIYSNLFSNSVHATGTPFVDAGTPGNSYLFLKVTDDQGTVPGGAGGPMPFGSAEGLTPDEQAIVEDWIIEGALEN